jgi:hypothetical protein
MEVILLHLTQPCYSTAFSLNLIIINLFIPFKAILILIIRHAKEMREGSRQTRKAAGGVPFV